MKVNRQHHSQGSRRKTWIIVSVVSALFATVVITAALLMRSEDSQQLPTMKPPVQTIINSPSDIDKAIEAAKAIDGANLKVSDLELVETAL